MSNNFSTGGTPEEFLQNMKNFKTITMGKINSVIKGITEELFTSIIRDTPVDYGWTQASWTFSVNKESNRKLPEYEIVNGAKVKIKYDRDKQGRSYQQRIVNEIKRAKAPINKKTGNAQSKYYLTNSAYPIHILEYEGWSAQAPQGMVKPNMQKVANMNVTKYAVYKPGDD